MNKKLYVGVTAAAACCLAFALTACDNTAPNAEAPEKLKDGEAFTLTVGETKQLDLAEYISVPSGYEYVVSSNNEGVLTVAVEEATATVSAVSHGNAVVTATAGDISITFAATVNAVPPTFNKATVSYDLYTDDSAEIELKPASGESTYSYTYALKTADENVTIAGNKLTAAYAQATQKTLTVVATYTDSAVTGGAARTVEFDVDVNVTDSTPRVKSETFERSLDIHELSSDIYDPEECLLKIDLAENIICPDGLALSYRAQIVGMDDQIFEPNEGSVIVVSAGDIPYEGVTVDLAVTVTGDGVDLSYTYRLTLRDSGAPVYNVVNGDFSNGLEGWTMDGDIGEVTERATYWTDLPMHNDGKYFSGEGDLQVNTGYLASSYFTVGGINKISFKLGSKNLESCYVALEDEDGALLRVWRNYKFEDTGDGEAEKVGKEKFILNLATYIADLSDFEGEKVRIVLYDGATSGFGFMTFDSLVTYYDSAEDLPTADTQDGRPVFEAVNELADKTALKNAVDAAITEQGDYTEESYDAYVEKLAAARDVLDNYPAARQATVDNVLQALNDASEALALRAPTAKNTDKNVVIVVDGSREISISDYVDENGLSSITYAVTAGDTTYVEVSEITNGKFTITAKALTQTDTPANVELKVLYKGEETSLTIDFAVSVIADPTPMLTHETVSQNIDLFTATNKQSLDIDFASNVVNPADQELSFTVKQNGTAVEGVAADGKYTFTYGEYTDTATEVVFNVSVGYTQSAPGTLTYTYTLSLTDTTAYRVVNGGFENDLDDWTKVGDIGGINSATEYWTERGKFNNDKKFFNAYTNLNDEGIAMSGNEGAKGTLSSSPFKLGGSGWITYMLGGAKNPELVYLEVVESETGVILDRFYNNAWAEENNGEKKGCSMTAFKADLSTHIGKTVYIRITDNASSDYGLFFVDSFVTYYAAEPANTDEVTYVKAESKKNLIYSVANAGFETGNLDGWTMEGDIGFISSANGYWSNDNGELRFKKDGTYFFEGREGKVADGEGNKIGSLTSSTFTLGGSGFITFLMGAAKNTTEQYIEVVDASDNTVLGRYVNTQFVDAGASEGDENKVSALTLIKFKADLHQHVGKTLYIRVVDSHVGGDFGMVMFDNVVTYYESADSIGSEFILAENKA